MAHQDRSGRDRRRQDRRRDSQPLYVPERRVTGERRTGQDRRLWRITSEVQTETSSPGTRWGARFFWAIVSSLGTFFLLRYVLLSVAELENIAGNVIAVIAGMLIFVYVRSS